MYHNIDTDEAKKKQLEINQVMMPVVVEDIQ
jgi:hypothetical protein